MNWRRLYILAAIWGLTAIAFWTPVSAAVSSTRPAITSTTLFSADSSGNAAAVEIWNTQPLDGIWVLGVVQGKDLLASLANNPNTTVNLPIRGKKSFALFGYPTFPFTTPGSYFGLNIFFDGSTAPGISAIGQLDSSTLLPNSSLLTIGHSGFGTVPGAGSLTYTAPSGKTVTLIKLSIFNPTVNKVDQVSSGETLLPDSIDDGVVTITLTSR